MIEILAYVLCGVVLLETLLLILFITLFKVKKDNKPTVQTVATVEEYIEPAPQQVQPVPQPQVQQVMPQQMSQPYVQDVVQPVMQPVVQPMVQQVPVRPVPVQTVPVQPIVQQVPIKPLPVQPVVQPVVQQVPVQAAPVNQVYMRTPQVIQPQAQNGPVNVEVKITGMGDNDGTYDQYGRKLS